MHSEEGVSEGNKGGGHNIVRSLKLKKGDDSAVIPHGHMGEESSTEG
jgi:hypothetical protein